MFVSGWIWKRRIRIIPSFPRHYSKLQQPRPQKKLFSFLHLLERADFPPKEKNYYTPPPPQKKPLNFLPKEKISFTYLKTIYPNFFLFLRSLEKTDFLVKEKFLILTPKTNFSRSKKKFLILYRKKSLRLSQKTKFSKRK